MTRNMILVLKNYTSINLLIPYVSTYIHIIGGESAFGLKAHQRLIDFCVCPVKY